MSDRPAFRIHRTSWHMFVRGAVRVIDRLVLRPIIGYHRRRASVAQLSALSDAMLIDIGLTRGEVPGAADRMMSDRGGAPSTWTSYPAVPPTRRVEELRRAA